jgi:predicted benzoate:H+ symporter BenE
MFVKFMSAESKRKFHLLLLADISAFVGMTCWFTIPKFGLFIFVGLALIGSRLGKAAKNIKTELDNSQKKLRFLITLAGFCFYFIAVICWILRFATPAAWCFGGLSIVVLAALLYSSHDAIYDGEP